MAAEGGRESGPRDPRNPGRPAEHESRESVLVDRIRYYETLIDCVHEVFLVIDRDFRITDVNNFLLRSLGYKRVEVIGRHCYEVSHHLAKACSGADHACPHAEVFRTGKPVQVVHKHISKSGEERWVDILASPFRDSGGNVVQVIEAVRDITDVIQAERRFRESEIFLNSVLEQSPISTCILDRDGTVTRINRACRDLFGIRDDDAMVGRYNLFEDPRVRERGFLPHLHRVYRDGETVSFRIDDAFPKAEGGPIPDAARRLLDITIFPVRNAQGLVMHAVMQHRDITEEQKLQEQLLQAQKMETVGTLAGGIAHDFNNILTGILGYCQLALMESADNHPLYGHLKLIESQALKAADLTRRILAFSRKQTLELKTVDLNQLIADLSKMLRRIIGEDVELRIRTAPDLPAVRADAAQIEQVIMNLCTNARDAMPEGGTLSLETRRVLLDEMDLGSGNAASPGPYVLLAVSDTGTGMDESMLQRIFEPFFTTKEVDRGTGLGLAMVYGVVRAHHGVIKVSSEPDVGTIFKIYLPVEAEETDSAGADRECECRGGNETILVAEDDPTVRDLVVKILKRYGYSVLTARDGQEALSVFEAHAGEIDLVLLDMVMPKKSGKEVYRSVRSQSSETRILVMSGYSPKAISESATEAGKTDFLHKPFSPLTLVRKVRGLLDRS